jgi:hypothetical protein
MPSNSNVCFEPLRYLAMIMDHWYISKSIITRLGFLYIPFFFFALAGQIFFFCEWLWSTRSVSKTLQKHPPSSFHFGRVCEPGPAARLRSRAETQLVGVIGPRSSPATMGKKNTLMALHECPKLVYLQDQADGSAPRPVIAHGVRHASPPSHRSLLPPRHG